MPEKQIYLLSCIKDEGPFLLEFVAHHLVLGFNRILIASNNCTDGSSRLLAALQEAGYIGHLTHSVAEGEKPQHLGYKRLRKKFEVDAADWVMMLDADEFLNVHVGDHSVRALTDLAPEKADIIALNAATFGDGGRTCWQPGPVTGHFLYRHPSTDRINGDVKTLSRNPGHYGMIHNHSLVRYNGPKARLTVMRGDGSLYDLDPDLEIWKQLRRYKSEDIRHDLAQYNHYAVKTPDAYHLRRARGRGAAAVGSSDIRHTDAYYARRARAFERDTTIHRYAPALAEMMARMLAHPDIRACQERTEQIFAERIAALGSAAGPR